MNIEIELDEFTILSGDVIEVDESIGNHVDFRYDVINLKLQARIDGRDYDVESILSPNHIDALKERLIREA